MRADSFGEGCGGVRRRAEGCRGAPKSAEECGGVRRSAEGGKVERRFGGRVEGGLEATWSSVRASGADLGRGRATGRSYLEASGAAGTARHGRVARVARRARHGTPALCGTARHCVARVARRARHGTPAHSAPPCGAPDTALRHTASARHSGHSTVALRRAAGPDVDHDDDDDEERGRDRRRRKQVLLHVLPQQK